MNNINNVVAQPIDSTVLHIRGKDATQKKDGYNTDFVVHLADTIIIKNHEELHISLMSAEVPYSFYNISSELDNNTLSYDSTKSRLYDR